MGEANLHMLLHKGHLKPRLKLYSEYKPSVGVSLNFRPGDPTEL